MIGSLHGVVEILDGSTVIVNVQGVGYRVHLALSIITKLHKGENIDLHIYSHIREDIFDLYGFTTLEDLKLFELFLGVSGIGPKTALGIFSAGNRDQIFSAVTSSNVKFFSSVPRLGNKNAQKLIIELKGKLKTLGKSGDVLQDFQEDEVGNALRNFGFKDKEIADALAAVEDIEVDASKKLKMALKYLGR
jgi:Holliday junction DNA helicase RuvA